MYWFLLLSFAYSYITLLNIDVGALNCVFFFNPFSDINTTCVDVLFNSMSRTLELILGLDLTNLVQALNSDKITTTLIKEPDYLDVVRLAETIELPEDFFSKMPYLERERAKDIENALRIGASTDDEFIESKMFFRMQKAYQILQPKTKEEEFLDRIAKFEMQFIEPMDYYTLNYTNKINIKGETVDVSK